MELEANLIQTQGARVRKAKIGNEEVPSKVQGMANGDFDRLKRVLQGALRTIM